MVGSLGPGCGSSPGAGAVGTGGSATVFAGSGSDGGSGGAPAVSPAGSVGAPGSGGDFELGGGRIGSGGTAAGTTKGGGEAIDGPPAGNPNAKGNCDIPAEARAENVSTPSTVIGNGTPESCTSDAFVRAVANGGIITFSCGPDPVTIKLSQTAKVVNNKTAPDGRIVIDGGGKVTLSGGGTVRILYQNTCDENQVWTSPTCQSQPTPALTVQNLTFVDGNATGQREDSNGGGGAIFVRGGRFKVINCRFFRNTCDATGNDVGGGAIRVLSQYQNLPVYVVNSTFGGKEGLGGSCSNGGALSSIDVSWSVYNSLFSFNHATGLAEQNPAGFGGGIYTDGGIAYAVKLCGTKMTDLGATVGGGAVTLMGNSSAQLVIGHSDLMNNTDGSYKSKWPGIYVWPFDIQPQIDGDSDVR